MIIRRFLHKHHKIHIVQYPHQSPSALKQMMLCNLYSHQIGSFWYTYIDKYTGRYLMVFYVSFCLHIDIVSIVCYTISYFFVRYLLIVLTITIVTVNRAFYREHQCAKDVYSVVNGFYFVLLLYFFQYILLQENLCLLIAFSTWHLALMVNF